MDQLIISAILSLTLLAGVASLVSPIASLLRAVLKYLKFITSGPIHSDNQNEEKRT